MPMERVGDTVAFYGSEHVPRDRDNSRWDTLRRTLFRTIVELCFDPSRLFSLHHFAARGSISGSRVTLTTRARVSSSYLD